MPPSSRAMRILPIAALLSLALAAPAYAGVPDTLQPPKGNKAFNTFHATGVQIYACNGTAWSFVAPRANLVNDAGNLKIIHFAGPTWQHKDGSKAVGTLFASPVTVSPTAIPWLLLSTTTSPGPFGDKLVKTTFIQRINTAGGLAPAAATCNAATAGTQAEVPYTADYAFWRAK